MTRNVVLLCRMCKKISSSVFCNRQGGFATWLINPNNHWALIYKIMTLFIQFEISSIFLRELGKWSKTTLTIYRNTGLFRSKIWWRGHFCWLTMWAFSKGREAFESDRKKKERKKKRVCLHLWVTCWCVCVINGPWSPKSIDYTVCRSELQWRILSQLLRCMSTASNYCAWQAL